MTEMKDMTLSKELIAEAVKRAMASLGEPGALKEKPPAEPRSGGLDGRRDFPLAAKRPELVKSAGGLSLEDITLEKTASGQISFDDIRIRPETLEYQAQIAESMGRPHLAGNLRRAAEITRIPDKRVLEIYNALRPYRCTKQELLDIATELDTKYEAKDCAAFVREAADVYEKRNRLKK
jgi:propanediol dehydratase small subunit